MFDFGSKMGAYRLSIPMVQVVYWAKNGSSWIFDTLDFESKMGVVLCGGFLGTLDIELKSRVGGLKNVKKKQKMTKKRRKKLKKVQKKLKNDKKSQKKTQKRRKKNALFFKF